MVMLAASVRNLGQVSSATNPEACFGDGGTDQPCPGRSGQRYKPKELDKHCAHSSLVPQRQNSEQLPLPERI
ncbi:hypothetical protein D6D13_10231 [Aureobasidium pullulans]|uniref:Uncharacterized protein n=1 Tax=Aureobasidium pullulans TaxID=5580 RepID=A0A4S9C1I1_AURPU|nr:hypothetical protein D6D13_10231 [Aureobasidium pullulans]